MMSKFEEENLSTAHVYKRKKSTAWANQEFSQIAGK